MAANSRRRQWPTACPCGVSGNIVEDSGTPTAVPGREQSRATAMATGTTVVGASSLRLMTVTPVVFSPDSLQIIILSVWAQEMFFCVLIIYALNGVLLKDTYGSELLTV